MAQEPAGTALHDDAGCWQGLAMAEMKRLLHLAEPIIASCFVQNAVNIMSLMFVGHLGKLNLAGASLAISITSATGLNIVVSPLYLWFTL
ncbi:hypothetical protein BAE44_0004039 [Dichanthelium oligosanthes]|uniref:Uncharacterized protein n=1 Tax=Dichanthelium oligosanthes TaxID=888268 RepID=A0A1E5WC17_9POAL|nr:hypothetical protein BAE44_0004039 [Dichanthelium oligosanthes]